MASRRPSEDANNELTNVGITLGKVIGGGSFAKVSAAKQVINGQEHKRAVKIMNLDKINDPRFESTFLARELEILRLVNHKHIVKVHDVIESGRFVYVITDLYACDLLQYIQQRGALTESVARRVIRELSQAVMYLHDSLDVAHRDLKTENLFLSYHGRLILGDFGFARKVGGELSATRCGSDGYIAPEVAASTRQIDAKLGDIWSVGVILFSVVTKSLPFDKRCARRALPEPDKLNLLDFAYPFDSYPNNLDVTESGWRLEFRSVLETIPIFKSGTWSISLWLSHEDREIPFKAIAQPIREMNGKVMAVFDETLRRNKGIRHDLISRVDDDGRHVVKLSMKDDGFIRFNIILL
ncbi:Oidioi.mRNA.OKI2018_I69.PAR.g11068.t1.cds [Oikopleura dioica]|uniref:non-specific serine/threonine protein kinase n=1 Tax=Oikopleura dioica TaxID=34765 RepID=A0ABN7RY94_OIKDI|nr:Oidioi.mRNA.OKI2018_I69.PAR.g11068.t1.cds [Oikopleura dioica]